MNADDVAAIVIFAFSLGMLLKYVERVWRHWRTKSR